MLRIIEDQAGNWDVRVTLADAARNAWAARVNDIRHATTALPRTDAASEAERAWGCRPTCSGRPCRVGVRM